MQYQILMVLSSPSVDQDCRQIEENWLGKVYETGACKL